MATIARVEICMVDLKPKVKRVDAIQSLVSQETPFVRITDSDGAVESATATRSAPAAPPSSNCSPARLPLRSWGTTGRRSRRSGAISFSSRMRLRSARLRA